MSQTPQAQCPACGRPFEVPFAPDPYVKVLSTPRHRSGLIGCTGTGRPLAGPSPTIAHGE